MLGAPSQPETSNSLVSSPYKGEGRRTDGRGESQQQDGERGRKGGCIGCTLVSRRVYDNRTLEVSLRETFGQVSYIKATAKFIIPSAKRVRISFMFIELSRLVAVPVPRTANQKTRPSVSLSCRKKKNSNVFYIDYFESYQ